MPDIVLLCLIASSTAIVSNNSEFSAEVTYGGANELAVQAFTLYDHAGEVIYHKEMVRFHTFFISDLGNVFALNEKELCLFRQDGEELLLQDLTFPNGFGFADDGSVFFASDKQGISAYSNAGEQIYAFCPGRLFASADAGNRVAIISTDTLFLYYRGMLKETRLLSTPYARRLRFSNDKGSLVIDVPGGTESLNILWEVDRQ